MAKEKKVKDLDQKSKDQDKKIRELTGENQNLKKKLGKLRKEVSKTDDALLMNQEYASQIQVEEKIRRCAHCSGEIKQFRILNILFDICQRCKDRVKVTEK